MAIPYFKYSTTYCYFDNGVEVPYTIDYGRYQSVERTENGSIKVYDHSMGGTYKRTWVIAAVMDNSASSAHKFTDFISFLVTTVGFAKLPFSYYDTAGSNYTVRIVGKPQIRQIKYALWHVQVTIEEDY